MEASESSVKRGYWDILGIALSIVCVAHCLATPVWLAVIPTLSAYPSYSLTFEWVLIGSIALLAGIVFYFGYRTHKRWEIIALYLGGLLIFFVARPLVVGFDLHAGSSHHHDGHSQSAGLEWLERLATLTGCACCAAGHYLNRRWIKRDRERGVRVP